MTFIWISNQLTILYSAPQNNNANDFYRNILSGTEMLQNWYSNKSATNYTPTGNQNKEIYDMDRLRLHATAAADQNLERFLAQ